MLNMEKYQMRNQKLLIQIFFRKFFFEKKFRKVFRRRASAVIECKKMPSQTTPQAGQPRTYVGEIVKLLMKK